MTRLIIQTPVYQNLGGDVQFSAIVGLLQDAPHGRSNRVYLQTEGQLYIRKENIFDGLDALSNPHDRKSDWDPIDPEEYTLPEDILLVDMNLFNKNILYEPSFLEAEIRRGLVNLQRFVKKKYPRAGSEGPRQGDPLLFAA